MYIYLLDKCNSADYNKILIWELDKQDKTDKRQDINCKTSMNHCEDTERLFI